MSSGENHEPSTPQKTTILKIKRTYMKTPKKESKANKALKFFTIPFSRKEDDVNNTYCHCKICDKQLSANYVPNLVSHLLYKHEKIYEENIGPIVEPVEVKRLKLLQNCSSIVALAGRPFASLNDFGFQNIIRDQLKEFSKAGIPLDLKSKEQLAVHKHLCETTVQVISAIKDSIAHQALSVQLDIATRLGRSILAIDVQYVANKQLNVHNIGMIELEMSHTGLYLSEVYRKCLERFEIVKQQIMSISADNGKNVRKMIRNEQSEAINQSTNQTQVARRLVFEPVVDINTQRNADLIDEEIEAVLSTEEISDDIDNDNAAIMDIFGECGFDVNDTIEQEALLRETLAEITKDHPQEFFDLTGINCAAHTLELLVKDSLKELRKGTSNIIDLCRRIIKALKLNSTKLIVDQARKSSSTMSLAEQPGYEMKVPSLDVETRWGSTYVMVSIQFFSFIPIIFSIFTFIPNN